MTVLYLLSLVEPLKFNVIPDEYRIIQNVSDYIIFESAKWNIKNEWRVKYVTQESMFPLFTDPSRFLSGTRRIFRTLWD